MAALRRRDDTRCLEMNQGTSPAGSLPKIFSVFSPRLDPAKNDTKSGSVLPHEVRLVSHLRWCGLVPRTDDLHLGVCLLILRGLPDSRVEPSARHSRRWP